jgi:hypothetical protein
MSEPLVFMMTVLPPTLNDIIASARTHRGGNAALKKKWTAEVASVAEGYPAWDGDAYLEWVWFVKNRARDQDNICAAQKYILDGLVAAGVLLDDNLKVIKTPVLHHVVIHPNDGFALVIRDDDAMVERFREDRLWVPPYEVVAAYEKLASERPSVPPARRKRRASPRPKRAARRAAVPKKNPR